MFKTVGIIGGFGPDTTAKFYLKIIEKYQNKTNNEKPNIFISNITVPHNIEKNAIYK